MKVLATTVALPSGRVTNDDIIQDIESRSVNFKGDLGRTLKYIRRGLVMSGSGTRTRLGENESPLALTVEACQKAIENTDNDQAIDLVISAGVYAELFEPATSNLIAHELGLDDAECFDIKEACDGWMKAAKIAYALIESGFKKRVLVVNGEFPLTPGFGIYPDLFSLTSTEQVGWRFPGFTLGEAATATIFGSDPINGWKFSNVARNDLYDLCTITMPWAKARSPRVAKDGPGVFTSYAVDLRKYGFPLAVETFRQSGIDPSEVDILFTHSSSKSDWREGAKQIGLANKLYDLYARCGNVVSAAVPAAMALAEEDGSLKRGHKVAAWIASAGMSFSTAEFVY